MNKTRGKKGLTYALMLLLVCTSLMVHTNAKISENMTSTPVIEMNDHGSKYMIDERGRVYVGGSGPGNYSTIQAGINAVAPNDVVFVYSGIYYENVVINKSISLIGENRDTTIIDAGYSGTVITITASYATLNGFTIRNGGLYGVYTNYATKNSVENCNIYGNTFYGIFFDYVADCIIQNTQSHHNNRYGIFIRSSQRCNLSDCTIYQNGNAKYYAHGIYAPVSPETTIINCTSYNNYYGIYLDTSPNSKIINCTTYGNAGYGIHLMYKSNNTIITNCTAYNNTGFGVFIEFTSYCKVINCVLHDTLIGVFLYSNARYNEVRNCTVYNNTWSGIEIRSISEYNLVTDCTSYQNYQGICLIDQISYNTLYHNNFFTNGENVYAQGENQWDNGKEGNYWDDYTGVDANGDGIGDTPYLINGNNQDHYPIMNLNGWLNNPPDTPTQLSGRTKGTKETQYIYTTSATDPNGDDVYYLWDWGDGNSSGWFGPYPSGQTISASHIWLNHGSYAVKVKAKDIYGKESNWSPSLTVNIYKLGDVNNDSWVSWRDIDPFVAAMNTQESDFELQHPGWIWIAADCNQDGYVNWRDINPFVVLMNT